MTETDTNLFNLIAYEKTLKYLSSQLTLTEKQVYQRLVRLQDKGYTVKRKIYGNGKQSFVLSDGLIYPSMHTTKIEDVTDTFQALLISDTHLGNLKECPDLLKYVMEYTTKNNINFIIHCGDIIDGSIGPKPKKITDGMEQIEYAIKNIPYDKSVIYLNLCGNHEHSLMEQDGLNVASAFQRRRPDFVSLGYGFGIINLADDQIIAIHRTDKVFSGSVNNKLILSGHKHYMATKIRSNGVLFNVPAFCMMEMNNIKTVPRAIDMKLSFSNGYIKGAVMKQLEFSPTAKVLATEDLEINLPHTKITEQEILPKENTIEEPVQDNQIEKFSKRLSKTKRPN